MKFFIIFMGIISFALLGWLFYILLLNREGDKAIELVIKVVTPLVGAGALIALEFFSDEISENSFVQALIILHQSGTLPNISVPLLKVGSEHAEAYSTMEWVWLKTIGPNVNFSRLDHELEKNATDLMEATIWKWLATKYSAHWYVERNYFSGISGGGGSEHAGVGAEPNPQKHEIVNEWKAISSSFAEPRWPNIILLPRGSKVSVSQRKPTNRIINLENKNIKFIITLEHVGRTGFEFTRFGEQIKSHLHNPEEWSSHHFRITFDVTYKRWRRWSPDTAQQKKWVAEIQEMFKNEFEWEKVRLDLEEGLGAMEPKYLLGWFSLPSKVSDTTKE